MDDDFVSSNAGALTMEAARYHLQLRRLAAFSTQLESAEQAARQITDRLESAVSDLRRALSELRTLTGTSADHVQVTLRAIESLLAAIAEKNLSKSISKSVVENVYAELTPLFASAAEEIAAKAATEVGDSTAQAVHLLVKATRAIAEAVGGKPPLPLPPDRDAPIFNKIHRRAIRGFARTHRFCITAAPLLGTLAALTVLAASVFYVGQHFFIPALR
jgi:hypothetical protein